jgi:nicotinate-nucleotide--dimethylbenzimidazole phosphoribosyltransferase
VHRPAARAPTSANDDELALVALLAGIRPAVRADADDVRNRLDTLTKPPGSLGRLEHAALRLAMLLGDPPPPLRRRSILVFAADHGIARRGVSAYPQAVTAQMCSTIAAGGAAICTIARSVDSALTLVDVGVAAELPSLPGVLQRRVRAGTRDMVDGPALTRCETIAGILVGAASVQERLDDTDIFALGELGIGNTTTAAVLTAAILHVDIATVVGRGTGLDDAGVERKLAVARAALDRVAARGVTDGALSSGMDDPLDLLAELGGLEIAALVGAILAAAAAGRPVVIDGFIVAAAALIAARLAPAARDAIFAAHCSAEPGHAVQLDALGLHPLLDLDLRLGEATGAALALPLLEAAAGVLREMASFEAAGVSNRIAPCE